MPALELLTGNVTGVGATLTGLTMAGSDNLTIRASGTARNVRLLNLWALNNTAGIARVRSPRMHDVNQGVRARVPINDPGLRLPFAWGQPLYVQDTLIAELSGCTSSTGIETMSLLLYYDDVPGSSAQFIDSATLKARGVNCMSVETAHVAGTAGGYSGSVAINSSMDNGKNNKLYALVGYDLDVRCASIGWRGIDTGNLRVGGPGLITPPHFTTSWFARLSDAYGLPLIPVFNWANKGSINVDVAQSQAGTAVTATSHLVELA